MCWLRLDFESFTILGPSDSVVHPTPVPTEPFAAEIFGGACADTLKVTVSMTNWESKINLAYNIWESLEAYF